VVTNMKRLKITAISRWESQSSPCLQSQLRESMLFFKDSKASLLHVNTSMMDSEAKSISIENMLRQETIATFTLET
jgi:hypothetical protein